jgi:hypothetical protein
MKDDSPRRGAPKEAPHFYELRGQGHFQKKGFF